jgi:hypothetical protein
VGPFLKGRLFKNNGYKVVDNEVEKVFKKNSDQDRDETMA